MSRSLSSSSSIEVLRREAKRWLKSITGGDGEALERLRKVCPERTSAPKLREVQQALAREHGFASWAALKQEIEDRARTHAERVRLFLEKSVHRYGIDPDTRKWGDYERDGPARGVRAASLLAHHPEIALDSIHTAVAAHDVEAVRSLLVRNTGLANDRSAFDGWTPLLRLAYIRLPTEPARTRALEIARLLLDAGADVGALMDDGSGRGFKVLTGVIGGGEAGQSPHPQAEALARLLIARGADPLDGQALYNTSLGEDDTFWLDLLWTQSEKRGETGRWHESVPDVLPPALDYLLGNAVPQHPNRAAWLLAHGAHGDATNYYSKQPVVRHAAIAGRTDLVTLLVAHGAALPELSNDERFLAAVGAGDIAVVRRLASADPQLLQRHEAMFAAIRQRRTDVAEALLDLGMSPDAHDDQNFTALHCTTHCGALEIARLLIARGAEIDPCELRHGGTPLTHACYHERADMIELLASSSCNFRGLCYAGAVARLRELLTGEPEHANREDRPGEPALFCLPGDEDKAVEVAELLLSFGANPSFRNPLGQTPAQVAWRRGLDEAAALLEDRQR